MNHKGTVTLETERLILGQLEDVDFSALYEIMRKLEVMYAWEHGFTLEETQEWLTLQHERYKNGYGFLAVYLKSSDVLIGQAGLTTSEIDGQPVTEIAYIFDNTAWGNGYATEAAKALVQLAFNERGIARLHCTVRPENVSSIKVAERLGFRYIGKYVKHYNGKEMPHLIYILENEGLI